VRWSVCELDFHRAGRQTASPEALDAVTALMNQSMQRRLPPAAFAAAAGLAYYYEGVAEAERAFYYYTQALEQLEAWANAIKHPRMIASFMRTPDIEAFAVRARAFAEERSPEKSDGRKPLPPEARQVFESIKRGFFDFEHAFDTTMAHFRRNEEGIRRIFEISQTLSSTAPVDELLMKVVDGVLDFTGAERGFIIRCEGKGSWNIQVARTMHREAIPRPEMQISRKIIDGIIETRRPVVVHDAKNEEQLRARESVINLELRSVMGAPMFHGGRLVGALYVDHTFRSKLFQEDDKQLLTIFANQVAIALENSRLVRDFLRDEKMRLMGLMASGVAHDFNNLLATISGRAQMVRELVEGQPVAEHVALIQKAARDGGVFVRRLQDFTRVSKTSDFETVLVRSIVDDVIGFTRTKWEGEGFRTGRRIRVLNDVDGEATALGSPAELREVFTNILLNSVAAMPWGGTIRFESEPAGDKVRVLVVDSGLGMTESVRESVFDPFFTTKDRKGSGLGMSIVLGILMRHGGTVEIDSRLGGGTTVAIELPRGSEWASRREKPPSHRWRRGNGQVVLVVDDEEGIRALLRDLLDRAGYRVVTAASGGEALALAEREPIDLVITDLGMVPMTGMELAGMLKQSRPGLPIILLTGWAAEMSPEETHSRSVDVILGKPFENAEVLAVISEALYGDGLAGRAEQAVAPS
jgi:signal transduction histidine kinase/ActR/RegA family two-component response regulator